MVALGYTSTDPRGGPLSLCSQKLLRSPRKPTRKISKIPFKVLDAPELQDDFYLNLVDWSSLNVLSVGLGTCVYLWSACTSQVALLREHVLGGQWGSQSASACVSGRGAAWGQPRGPCPWWRSTHLPWQRVSPSGSWGLGPLLFGVGCCQE